MIHLPNAIVEKAPLNAFSEYPEKMDTYFARNITTIRVLPDNLDPSVEKIASNFQITSASQYIGYLHNELAFWKEHDPNNKLSDFVKRNLITNAISNFETAHKQYINSSGNGDYYLGQSVSQIRSGTLYSKSALAQYLLTVMDRGQEFLTGFRYGLSSSKSSSFSTNTGLLEGFYAALEYRKFVAGLHLDTLADAQLFEKNVRDANEQYATLLYSYTASFHDQEVRLKDLINQTNQQFDKLSSDCDAYFKERDSRCTDLENLYQEKLRLEAPAEYWKELDTQYNRAGWVWFTFSVLFTIGIVAGLVLVLKYLPNLFSEDSHWIEVFKNSAIITVMTSIAVYLLRLFVKMAVSSFHLSRDAKERNKLTYFYLALIEKKAVTEKERAIILNSLFSRADTGLLKGDSSPTMSGNVAELVDILAKK